MTITELYEYAKKLEIENLPIYVTYECSDSWYDFNGELTKDLIEATKDKVEFQLEKVTKFELNNVILNDIVNDIEAYNKKEDYESNTAFVPYEDFIYEWLDYPLLTDEEENIAITQIKDELRKRGWA